MTNRHLTPPPEHSPPGEDAQRIIDAIHAYVTGSDRAGLTARQRAIGAHHIAQVANDALGEALARAHDSGVSWPVLSKTHGLAESTVAERARRAKGLPPRTAWKPRRSR
jgi:hypothetical protein